MTIGSTMYPDANAVDSNGMVFKFYGQALTGPLMVRTGTRLAP